MMSTQPGRAPDTLRPLHPADTAPLEAYRTFARAAHDHRPWVLANVVAGVDGAISIDGRVGDLSSPADKRVFRLLRSIADVVLVGAGTFRAERYAPSRLAGDLRAEREERGQPAVPRIAVVSRSLQLDLTAPFFTDTEVEPIVITSEASDPAARQRTSRVAEVLVAGDEHVEPTLALQALQAGGARVVLCEGGAALNADLLAAGVLDELCLTISPLVGGDPSRIVADEPRPDPTDLELVQVAAAGDELYLRYLVRSGDRRG